ncbi:hypothetical protein [Bifidobacterium ruminantium]|uniref:Uncharacterized protein n=1 Tax=Bifidobacterium ruminantium TaxID=78346 RepID=A0A087CPP4_BIFRU|nr:hypothetical protein [Bifidobacterium ruminantium]KFI85244.1 hypothetical protein BRUM_1908 [Bifidobacterium ruminantium]
MSESVEIPVNMRAAAKEYGVNRMAEAMQSLHAAGVSVITPALSKMAVEASLHAEDKFLSDALVTVVDVQLLSSGIIDGGLINLIADMDDVSRKLLAAVLYSFVINERRLSEVERRAIAWDAWTRTADVSLSDADTLIKRIIDNPDAVLDSLDAHEDYPGVDDVVSLFNDDAA